MAHARWGRLPLGLKAGSFIRVFHKGTTSAYVPALPNRISIRPRAVDGTCRPASLVGDDRTPGASSVAKWIAFREPVGVRGSRGAGSNDPAAPCLSALVTGPGGPYVCPGPGRGHAGPEVRHGTAGMGRYRHRLGPGRVDRSGVPGGGRGRGWGGGAARGG